MNTMRTVWEVVAAQAQRTPDATAIIDTTQISYEELAGRAIHLAERIAELTEPGDLVALDADTASAGVISFLAAARARCALLPLNRQSPALQRATMLADARPVLMIEQSDTSLIVKPIGRDPGADSDRRDMRGQAYVIYTSGSTGKPKGVVISQEAMLVRLAGLAEMPGLGPTDRMLAMTALSFDISIAELLLPLTVGAHLVAAPPDTRLDPALFAQLVQQTSPTVIQATPSFWHLALAWGWRGLPHARIWCGGEALREGLARSLLGTCAELWNLYGPTEATIWATACRVSEPGQVNLGQPLPGTGMCLQGDDGSTITDPGRQGEILLYGAGIATGYLGQPALTDERFPVRSTPTGDVRCYRTGDVGRYTQRGTVEFIGRTDGQVKLRGHRIELGEIEQAVEEHPRVSQAVAVLLEPDSPERKHIALYIVTQQDLQVSEIRRWLAARLPMAARPQRIEVVPSLPRTSAGKADRARLAEMLTDAAAQGGPE